MISAEDGQSLRAKHAELVEFLRNNLPDGAKKLVVENEQLLEFTDESGRLPVHWAAVGGCLPFIMLALEKDPQLPTRIDDSGWTTLMIAVSAGRLEVVRFLLGCTNCEVNHRNCNGQTSLHYAASKNHVEIARMLLENGADVNAQDKYGNSPLHRASALGHMNITQILLKQKGVRVDLTDREGNTPLHIAVEDENDSVALCLVRHGADINRQNNMERTPLDLAKTADLRRKLKDAASELGG